MSVFSCNFEVYVVSYLPKAGTRYLIEPNGARLPFTASSVPSATNTTVVCSVSAGYPFYIERKYSSGYTWSYYEITGADRSKLVTTTAAKAIGVTSMYGQSS